MSVFEPWKKDLRFALQTGLLDQRADIIQARAIEGLLNGDPRLIMSSPDAFSMGIEDYIEKCELIGELGLLNAATNTAIDCCLSSIVTVIRGTPRASLLHYLGRNLNLKPESVLEHYEFPNTFRIRSLPSRPSSVITIRFISLGVLSFPPELEHDATALRAELNHQVREYCRAGLGDDRIGIERCRKINMHDGRFFTVEQQATFLTYEDSRQSWSGILLTDCGRPSSFRPWIPQSRPGIDAQFYPAASSGICSMSSINCENVPRVADDKRNYNRPNPFLRAFSDKLIMSSSDRKLCVNDPFMFLSDVLDTSTLSWMHVLSYLRASYESLPPSPSDQAARLRADKEMLERGLCYFTEVLSFLRHPPENWQHTNRSKEVAQRLETDFKVLHNEAESLSTWCTESISIAMSTISIMDSQQSLAEARRVQLITVLAFIFIPMTFIASCFGMNIQELSQLGSTLGRYLSIALPFTLSMLMIPLWIEGREKIMRKLRVWRCKVHQ